MRLFRSAALGMICSPGLFKGVWGESGKNFSVSLSFLPGHVSASGHLPSAKASPLISTSAHLCLVYWNTLPFLQQSGPPLGSPFPSPQPALTMCTGVTAMWARSPGECCQRSYLPNCPVLPTHLEYLPLWSRPLLGSCSDSPAKERFITPNRQRPPEGRNWFPHLFLLPQKKAKDPGL